MSSASLELTAGQSVSHPEMGLGVFVSLVPGGYARVFFQQLGERQVPVTSALKGRVLFNHVCLIHWVMLNLLLARTMAQDDFIQFSYISHFNSRNSLSRHPHKNRPCRIDYRSFQRYAFTRYCMNHLPLTRRYHKFIQWALKIVHPLKNSFLRRNVLMITLYSALPRWRTWHWMWTHDLNPVLPSMTPLLFL